MNSGQWSELPRDIQAILREEGAKIEAESWAAALDSDRQQIIEHQSQGMVYTPPSADMLAAFRSAAIEQVVPAWAAREGGTASAAVQIFNREVRPIIGVVVT